MKSFIAFYAILGVALAAHPSFKPYNTSAETIFHSSDYNHDGVFSRDELDQAFAKYDSDGDGRISRHEYTIHLTQEAPSLHDFAHALYDDYDMNGDHHLDHSDFDMYFAKIDSDGKQIILI
ncbi:hypothetical protein FSP39_004096 [Pinctada imbricata]|uniref:EF-hand domain-containing protein n=1 Tax=Pinctada imbricata TaxID=66713 RepID=A0AA89BMV2_PINIB|nr:hypothetical protein FSP39_004096 [Pinctada imbricata]